MRVFFLLRLAVLVCLAAAWPLAQAQKASEQEVKAAYLYRFLPFVEWPRESFARPDSPIVIAVGGAADIAEALAQIVDKRTAQGRPIVVRRLAPGEVPGDAHLVFLGAAESARLPAIAKAAQARSMLVVCDWTNALDQGAAVNFVPVEGRVRFEVALEAAERTRIRLSSRMLAVAYNVRMPGS